MPISKFDNKPTTTVLPNPKHYESRLDEDVTPEPKSRYVEMNIENPPAGTHPLEHAFQRHGVRHQLGQGIPKEDVTISNN
jgi:hypothetical protein